MALNNKQKQILNRYQDITDWSELPEDVRVSLMGLTTSRAERGSTTNGKMVRDASNKYMTDNYVRLIGGIV